MTATQTRGSAAMQGALSGAAAEDWASLMEPQGRALFDAVLNSGPFKPGARVLDAGCGSGLLAQCIAARGCVVFGLDDPSQVAVYRFMFPPDRFSACWATMGRGRALRSA